MVTVEIIQQILDLTNRFNDLFDLIIFEAGPNFATSNRTHCILLQICILAQFS